MLLELIKRSNLSGSARNKTTVVFDGFPDQELQSSLENYRDEFEIIFSRGQSADQRIRDITEGSSNPKTVVVVSDDKQIIFYIRACKARGMSVKEFLREEGGPKKAKESDSGELKVNYSQMQKINQELKDLWLK